MNFLLLKLDIAIVTVFFRYSSSFKFNEGLKKLQYGFLFCFHHRKVYNK